MQQSQNSVTWGLWIQGKVQGVGYRRFAQKVAVRMQLTGWVRNLADGRVEVRVNATQEQLDSLVLQLKKGPAHGEVTDIRVEKTSPDQFSDFLIQETV